MQIGSIGAGNMARAVRGVGPACHALAGPASPALATEARVGPAVRRGLTPAVDAVVWGGR
jgi:hypothetical protein